MILTSGAFDGLHAGHVQYLEAAKALCEGDELLVCAIAPDEYIVQTKGRKPYWHQADRLRTVTALGCIDAAIPQQRQSVADLIEHHRPRLFIKGPDWEGRLPEDIHAACELVGTSIGYVDTPGTHVSETRLTDDAALAQFEALWFSQQRPSEPWSPVTPFDFESRKVIEGKHPKLIIDTFGKGPFLDYGCGPDAILVRLLRERGIMAYGIDPILKDEWQCLQPRWDSGPEEFVGEFPVIICREVFEHLPLRDFPTTIRRFKDFSPKFVYVTTRFAKSPAHFLSVETSDDLDPTHITMLNQNFLRALFVLEGFKRRKDLESRLDWLVKGRVLVYERA